jgi:two-component system nitrogen regulation sensor histidine kinase NtrY
LANSIYTTLRNYLLPILLGAAIVVSLLKPSSNDINSVGERIQKNVTETEEKFSRIKNDKKLLQKIFSGENKQQAIEQVKEFNLNLFAYRNDTLVFWSDYKAVPFSSPAAFAEGASITRLKNGWYQSFRYSDSLHGKELIGLAPLKYQYPFENRFLHNVFDTRFNVPENIEFSDKTIPGAINVNDGEGSFLFAIYTSEEIKETPVNYPVLLVNILVFLIIGYYINFLSGKVVKSKGLTQGMIVLVLGIIAFRLLVLFFDEYTELAHLEIFNPKYYASSALTKSLGDLIINSVLLTWAALFFTFHYNGNDKKEYTRSSFKTLAGIGVIYVFTGAVVWLFKTLILDSVISFEIYNILSLGWYSLLGLICISSLLLVHFLVSKSILEYLGKGIAKSSEIVLFSVLCAVIYGCTILYTQFYQVIVFSGVWCVFYILVLKNSTENPSKAFMLSKVILYLGMYSLLGTFLIETLYESKERNQRLFFAGKLVTERDHIAEYTFNDISGDISKDAIVKNFFTNPLLSKKEVVDRINSRYLSGYFNKYELTINAFDKDRTSIKSADTLPLSYYEEFLANDTMDKDVTRSHLHYLIDTNQNYIYQSIIEIPGDSGLLGAMVLRLTPRIYNAQNVYPELLLGHNISNDDENSAYDYAIYQNDNLIMQHGDFPYTYTWNKNYKFEKEQYAYIDFPGWEHIIYRFSNNKKVIVTIPQEGLFEPVATFSYIFTFLFIITVVLLGFARLTGEPKFETDIVENFSLSFRTRINYSMLAIIIVSFIFIGIVTMSFFRQQYDNFYTDRLLRKEKAVNASLEYFIQGNNVNRVADATDYLETEVARLAAIDAIDINLFDGEGNLVVASQEGIYDKGLVSKKMNPSAYTDLADMRSSQSKQQENIGQLSYMAIYSPIRNTKGETVAFLGIPYFEKAKDVNDEVSSFLVALMNVYVFLLICAAIIAYFISNSITRPLTIISEKLRILNLNKRNEPIEWNSKDEIGVLIGEYNKMITELEQSAQKLARSERESAWREMAKQIAHEIKNPLTPMKLSIQYLQRAIDDNNPNIHEMAKKVSKTLVEQIDALTAIATAFSSFAQMPKGINEVINLNDLLRGVTELFGKEENAKISFTSNVENPLVFADKNQMISVFNNLVKNAIQSIPETREGYVDVSIRKDNGFVEVSVKDNGSGISEANYGKVFVPNFTTKSSGTGLGLAISKQIIEHSKGEIWFESVIGEGTTFFVKLPMYTVTELDKM